MQKKNIQYMDPGKVQQNKDLIQHL